MLLPLQKLNWNCPLTGAGSRVQILTCVAMRAHASDTYLVRELQNLQYEPMRIRHVLRSSFLFSLTYSFRISYHSRPREAYILTILTMFTGRILRHTAFAGPRSFSRTMLRTICALTLSRAFLRYSRASSHELSRAQSERSSRLYSSVHIP